MPALQAVLFDVDDTLFSTTEFAALARRHAVRAMIGAGLNAPEELVVRELEEVIREFSSNYEHHYDKLLMRLPRQSLLGTNPTLVVTAGVVAYHDTKFRELRPFPDVKPLLEALRDAGVLAGVVTHGLTLKQAEKLVRLQLVPLLAPDAIFISDQVGISKPNPKLWATALRSLELPADRVMYVGDNLENDIRPPQSLGMPTVWATRAAKPQPQSLAPDHAVADFCELADVLREHYGLPLADIRQARARL